jgi:alkylation response protein AidB-like acyl-CoA dehydrogenase
VWQVTGPVTPEALGATAIATGDHAETLYLTGVVLTAALQLGVAVAAGQLATAYAKEREQFGRPIGGFQAVKHLCADMLVKAEVARAAVYAAACALDGASDDDPAVAASAAKVVAGEAALANGRYGIQVHGGMGFTWEVHAQRYWKRAVSLDVSFGSISTHCEIMADALWALTKRNISEATRKGLVGVGGNVFKLAYSDLRHRLGELALQLLERASLSLDDIGDLPTGAHVQGRIHGISISIAAGTSQVQKNIVAERVLGLPKDR